MQKVSSLALLAWINVKIWPPKSCCLGLWTGKSCCHCDFYVQLDAYNRSELELSLALLAWINPFLGPFQGDPLTLWTGYDPAAIHFLALWHTPNILRASNILALFAWIIALGARSIYAVSMPFIFGNSARMRGHPIWNRNPELDTVRDLEDDII